MDKTAKPRNSAGSSYLAGQVTCRSCGHVMVMIRNVERDWLECYQCLECEADVALGAFWPVEDQQAIGLKRFCEATEAIALGNHRRTKQ